MSLSLSVCVFLFGLSIVNGLGIAEPFPQVRPQNPVDLQQDPVTPYMYVVEQGGRILYWRKDQGEEATTSTFLNIQGVILLSQNSEKYTSAFSKDSDRVNFGGEKGLLGLAFPPNYGTSKRFFVYYTAGNLVSRVSKFTATTIDPPVADANSEEILLTFTQPFDNHNGGQITFGPDGNLYIASGDGGSGNDPGNRGQDRTTYLGKILRINVDGDTGYTIPNGNPYKGNTQGFLEEIWAYGLRNPWRMSFDFATGYLWAGDVGQGALEEIDIIESGGNYGWKIMEGNICRPPTEDCDMTGLILPVHVYPRGQGISVTGGFVYRGTKAPELFGKYIYADYDSGRIWALTFNPADPYQNYNELLFDTSYLISSFGVDRDNNLYFLHRGSGHVYEITNNGTILTTDYLPGTDFTYTTDEEYSEGNGATIPIVFLLSVLFAILVYL